MKRCIVILFLLIIHTISYAQGPDTSITIYGKGTRGPYILGFNNLIAGSVSVLRDDGPISADSFDIEYTEGILELSEPLPIGDSLSASFRYVPLNLKPRYFLHNMAISHSDTAVADPPAPYQSEQLLSDLSITGSKGFSFQAGQGVDNSLSQSLNLSITGDLIPGLRTSAHISDKSNGTNGATRRLDELDKIYIQAESDNFKGVFGDFDYTENRDPLLGFQRKLTGLNTSYYKNGAGVRTAAAFFPGEYSTITINGHDGQLGPYYLTDVGGRQGAQVLPGSERIYLDGLLQSKDNDYQIDYEAGTIQFAPNKVIRDESRITVDYEVAREEYSRSFYTISGEAQPKPGFRIFSNLLQEGDNKGSPKSFEMTDDIKTILQDAGAERFSASQSGVRYVGPDSGSYNIDSTSGIHYVYAGENHGSYNVAFSFIGANLGSYRALGGDAFSYVGPGIGDYEPVILIPLPQTRRYGSIGSAWISNDSTMSLQGELAGSLYDRNALSSIDPVQQGTSALGSGHIRRNIFGESGFVGLDARIRAIGRDAIFPGRIDDVERYRQYDLDASLPDAGEKVQEITVSGGPAKDRALSYEFGYLTHPEIKSRRYQAGGLNWRLIGPLNVSSHAELTQGTRTWWKRDAQLTAGLRRIQPMVRVNYERRDGLDGFKYYEYIAGIPAMYTQNINGVTEFNFRNEKYLDNTWRDKFQSGSIQQSMNFVLGQSGISGELAGSYYRKHYQDYTGTDAEQRTGWTRLTYSDPIGRGSLSLNERLSSSNERLQAKNYVFVGEGRGDYRLEDGEYIKDPQGDYIVVIDELGEGARITEIKTEIGATFSPLIAIDPTRKIETSAGRLSLESDLAYSLKKSSNRLLGWDFFPWRSSHISDIVLRNGQLDMRVYYYPPRGKHRIRYNLERTFENGAPYANESADNQTRLDELSWAFPATKKLDIFLTLSTSNSRRNVNGIGYDIDRKSVALSNNYRFTKLWTFTLGPSYENDRQSDTGLKASLPSVELGLARDFERTGRLSATVGYGRMIISPLDAYVPFQMAQGRGPGDNYEATVTGRMTVTKNGRFDLSYRFEDYAKRPVRHNFRMEFTVLFL